MANIRKHNNKWQTQIRRKGHRTFTKSFLYKKDAETWTRTKERELDNGGAPVDKTELRAISLAEMLIKYRDTIVSRKRSRRIETYLINSFIRQKVAILKLSEISPRIFADYRDKRLKIVKPASVCRELAIYRHAFQVAIDEWHYNALPNPLCLVSMIDFDRFMMKETIEVMKDFFKNKFTAVFAIPVHYKTVFNITRLHSFLFLCKSIPEPLRKYISFTLVGYPEGFPESSMHEIIANLNSFTKNVLIYCDKVPSDISYYKASGTKGICLTVPSKIPSPEDYWSNVRQISAQCKKENLSLFINGIDEYSDLIPTNISNLNFIAGNLIGSYTDVPSHMAQMNWKELSEH